MNLKKSFHLALITVFMSALPAFAVDNSGEGSCEDIIATHRKELHIIKNMTQLDYTFDILSIHADNLWADLKENMYNKELSHEEAQEQFEEISLLRVCASGAFLTKFEK